jgi:Tol biopolymer transport system component
LIGQSLSHFRITAELGEGGMGTVYRAEDTALGREVALKILPQSFADNSERLARFEREAKVLASLSHPNIAGIYEVGAVDGVHFLAMELARGEDLADRLRRGPIPRDEALALAIQLAEALSAAHESGIVHRDLKPANLKITADKQIKVLDFGLAKAWATPTGGRPDMTHSPTLTAEMTQAGTLLGTAAYMSPEQARGEEADRRADVWAFGLVLVEMLSGRKAFNEPTVSDTLAAVLKTEPDLSALPDDTPPALRRLIDRCLQKNPDERLRDMGDVGLELREIVAGAGDTGVAPAGPGVDRPAARRFGGLLPGLALGLLAALAAWWLLPDREVPADARSRMVQFDFPAPEGTTLVRGLAVSPDGSMVVVTARDQATDRNSLWVRRLDSRETRRIDGTEDALYPFWSPDSRQIGFFAGGELRIVDLLGSPPRSLIRTAVTTDTRGAAWSVNGRILFAPLFVGGLFSIDAKGGESRPEAVPDPDGGIGTLRFPGFLPDGRHFLVYAAEGTGNEPGEIHLGELGVQTTRRLTEASSAAIFVPPDRLLYVRGDVLVSQGFDPVTFDLTSDPVPLGPRLAGGLAVTGLRSLSASAEGTLAYRVESFSATGLVWARPDGSTVGEPIDDLAWHYGVSISPDGRTFMVSHYPVSAGGGLWLRDRERGVGRPLITRGQDSSSGVFSPDGKRIAYQLVEGGAQFKVEVSEIEDPESATTLLEGVLASPTQWAPDGSGILVNRNAGNRDIVLLDLEHPGEVKELLATAFAESDGQLSPDGRWLAYSADNSGRAEIYVRPFRAAGAPWQVSVGGGDCPRWSRDGEQIFFLSLDGWLNAVTVTDRERFATAPPTRLFDPDLTYDSTDCGYDVAPDGTFLLNQEIDTGDSPVVVVVGLDEYLAQTRP